MTDPRWIDVPGPPGDLKALTWGPPDGPIALCLHGFPDTAYGWRKVAPLLARAGWRVVAPFMRGYAPSAIPDDGSYHGGAIMDDALRVRSAAGGTDRDVVIGHDWGALAATGLAAMPNSPFTKAVIMSLPVSAGFRGQVSERGRLARQLPRQLLRSWYLFYFQLPFLPERSARWILPLLWRRWSPGYRGAEEDLRHVDAAIGTPQSWRAALGTHRATLRNTRPPQRYAELNRLWIEAPILPSLYLHGRDDGCMTPAFAHWTEKVLPPGSDVTIVDHAGHFLQLEQPDKVAERVLAFVSAQQTDPMTAHRMAAIDAEFYWMSAKVPSDDFQLWAFDGQPADLDAAIDELCRRARGCPDLTMRVHDGSPLTFPQWVPAPVSREQVVCHDLVDPSWHGCLAAIVGLADHQLDIRQMLWRVHVFTPVFGIPGVDGPGTVVLWQYPHALAGGVRASAMGAWLFGRTAPLPEVRLERAGFLPWRALDAARTHRQLVRDTQAGLVAPGIGYRPLLPTNAPPAGVRSLRTLVRHRSQMPGPTVTVAVLAAVSTALSDLFGDAADSLAAEVPMAKFGVPPAYNHFGNVVVGLYPQLDWDARVQRIAADLANGRRRFEHPSKRSADRAFAAVPAALLRWGVSLFDPDARPSQVLGNTVVSSNNRGPADLNFGGLPVVLTATYPPLSSVMGLTHGVHGIGETIAISVNAAESAIADIDDYLDRLDAAL